MMAVNLFGVHRLVLPLVAENKTIFQSGNSLVQVDPNIVLLHCEIVLGLE